jgi:hypothetical protein
LIYLFDLIDFKTLPKAANFIRMTIKEIVEQENQNRNSVRLHQEGIFYRAYNQSAMRIVEGVKTFKINHKFVKTANREVFYVGFPCASIESVNLLFQNNGWQMANDQTAYADKTLVFFSEILRNDDYESWCKVVLLQEAAKEDTGRSSAMDIQTQIERFPIEDTTPMEAFLFLNRLKQQIRNGNVR